MTAPVELSLTCPAKPISTITKFITVTHTISRNAPWTGTHLPISQPYCPVGSPTLLRNANVSSTATVVDVVANHTSGWKGYSADLSDTDPRILWDRARSWLGTGPQKPSGTALAIAAGLLTFVILTIGVAIFFQRANQQQRPQDDGDSAKKQKSKPRVTGRAAEIIRQREKKALAEGKKEAATPKINFSTKTEEAKTKCDRTQKEKAQMDEMKQQVKETLEKAKEATECMTDPTAKEGNASMATSEEKKVTDVEAKEQPPGEEDKTQMEKTKESPAKAKSKNKKQKKKGKAGK